MNPCRETITPRIALTLLLALAPALTAQSPSPIKIETGKLQGVLTSDQKVIAYKGIPYAQPPIGGLRWRAPQPPQKWHGTFAAANFGAHCVQFGSAADMTFHDPGASEDCLTLNVWAPANTGKHTKLPVMVWIHGGGFYMGGSSESRQSGEFLAHRNVILVSMNYRLGIFGFFAHPELTAESPAHASGNYGLLDQAAALAWVHRNIQAFGGDPANVTLFGQSAGSQSVSVHMASPLSAGLFAKAIGQSGSEFARSGHDLSPREQAEQADAAWAERTFGSSSLASLRSLSTDDIVQAVHTHRAPSFGPVVDGLFLTDTLVHLYAQGKQAHIPLLAGWVANESYLSSPPSAEAFTTQAQTRFDAQAPGFLAAYPASTDAQAAASAADFATDQSMGLPTWAWIEAQTNAGNAPVYRYFFALANPGDRNHTPALGSFHSDDIEYVFGTLDSRPEMAIRPEDRLLSDQIQQYWTNFAKTGDPNLSTPNAAKPGTSTASNLTPSPSQAADPALPNWPAYNPATGYQVMRLDAPSTAQPDTHRPRYLFLNAAWNTPEPTPAK